jgi:hypothetical protein
VVLTGAVRAPLFKTLPLATLGAILRSQPCQNPVYIVSKSRLTSATVML